MDGGRAFPASDIKGDRRYHLAGNRRLLHKERVQLKKEVQQCKKRREERVSRS